MMHKDLVGRMLSDGFQAGFVPLEHVQTARRACWPVPERLP